MTLADLIRKKSSGQVATAIPAIPAIPVEQSKGSAATVATIATIAVANSLEAKTKHSELADVQAAREAFEERAAIREYDGGFNRKEAERLAHDDLFGPFRAPSALRSLHGIRRPAARRGVKNHKAVFLWSMARPPS